MTIPPSAPAAVSPPAATILVVDDTKDNLTVMGEILAPLYRVRLANTGEKCLRAAATPPAPNLILLDIMMPEMNGYEVLKALRRNPQTQDIPVIFVTAMNTDQDEELGLSLGAVDYITKPIHPAILLARVKTQLALKAALDQVKNQNQLLETRVQERTQALKRALELSENAQANLRKSYFSTLQAFGELIELRGGAMGSHAQRVADLSRKVALHLGMEQKEAQDVFVAALLHDMGKIGFPDSLLTKPVSLMSSEELGLYRRHPAIGANALSRIEALSDVASLIMHHHEHYDGTGFPAGLSALDIPLGARIIAAASDYDSLRNGGLTKEARTAKQSFEYLLDGRGSRYDPQVVDRLEAILSVQEKFEIEEIPVKVLHLQEGMTLTRDLLHPDGFVLLSKATALNRRLIDQLVAVDRQVGPKLVAYVQRGKTKAGMG